MPRTIDQIRASKLPSNMMQFAAKGALSVPADENIEILVYLAKHNKVFGDLARMTLAGWDEKASLAAASNPKTSPEVLHYFVSPENLRPKLLPALLENPSVSQSELAKFAIAASPESIQAMLKSPRVCSCREILKPLRSNPYLKAADAAAVEKLLQGDQPAAPQDPSGASITKTAEAQTAPTQLPSVTPESEQIPDTAQDSLTEAESRDGEEASDETVSAYLAENAAEIAAEQHKPFQAVGGALDLSDDAEAAENADSPPATPAEAQPSSSARASAATARKPAVAAYADAGRRDNTLQKINKLDVKGRIQLALKGSKEERSILIRDGTKVVALAVLEAPKLSDGEVEKFALQKNVLEAVLRQIPLKRRFMKNYIVVRNLVANPRTPLDLGLGLMKHLLVQDLKNLSANKEVSETVRKLALKMFKQKMETASKKN